LVGGGELPEEHVVDRLFAACEDNEWIDDVGMDGVLFKIRHGLEDGKMNPKNVPPDQGNDDDTSQAQDISDTTSGIDTSTWSFTDGASFILDIPDTIPALWGKGNEVAWPEGESLMITGPLGLGKTTLAIQLLHARLGLGNGRVLGLPVTPRPGKVLYLAMDRPAQIARAAHRLFTEEERHVLAERVLFWRGPPPADIAKHPLLLNALAEAANADTVFLDSIKDAAIGLSDDAVGAGYNRARQHLLAEGRQLLEIHHPVKRGAGGGPPTTIADVYGATWITNGAGSVFMLSGDPGDPIVGFRHLRPPAYEIGPYQLLHDQEAGQLTIHDEVDLVALARCNRRGITARDAAQNLFGTDKPTPAQIAKARRGLDKHGELRRVEGAAGGAEGGIQTVWVVP
jgi:AAA domain